MDECRKRVLSIGASILVARHLKDLNDVRSSPLREALLSNAIKIAARIMQKIDNNFPEPHSR